MNEKHGKFIENILDRIYEKDKDLVSMAGQLASLCFLPKRDYEYFSFFQGLAGSGKGTFFGAVIAAVGSENVASAKISDLENSHIIDSLVGKPLLICTESDGWAGKAGNTLKAIVSGDPLLNNPKNKRPHTVTFNINVMMSTNNEVKFKDNGGDFKRRIRIMPHNVQFETADGQFDRTIKREVEEHGKEILLWMCQKAHEVSLNGMLNPEACKAKFKEMQSATDEIYAITNQYIQVTGEEKDVVSKGQLRALLNRYREEIGIKPRILNDRKLTRDFRVKLKEIYGHEVDERQIREISYGKETKPWKFIGIKIRENSLPFDEQTKLSVVLPDKPPF